MPSQHSIAASPPRWFRQRSAFSSFLFWKRGMWPFIFPFRLKYSPIFLLWVKYHFAQMKSLTWAVVDISVLFSQGRAGLLLQFLMGFQKPTLFCFHTQQQIWYVSSISLLYYKEVVRLNVSKASRLLQKKLDLVGLHRQTHHFVLRPKQSITFGFY